MTVPLASADLCKFIADLSKAENARSFQSYA